MKRAALYCRVSSLKQVREGDSLDAQISALRNYVAEHNYLVNAGEYIDDGISGTKFDERDDLQRLLRDVEDGKIDIILVCRIDRWFRSVRHYTATQEILDKNNVGWLAIMAQLFSTGHIAQYTRVYFGYSDILQKHIHVYIIRAIKNNEPPHRSPVRPHQN